MTAIQSKIGLFIGGDPAAGSPTATLFIEKCANSTILYDFCLLIYSSIDSRIKSATSTTIRLVATTGGVYKARGRIHRVLMKHDY